MKYLSLLISLMVASNISLAAKGDDPVLGKFMLDQLEVRDDNGDTQNVVEGQGWIGQDLNKFWIKLDSEYESDDEYESELQLLYSKAVDTYWDMQLGVRIDEGPDDSQGWAVIGLQGLAPYYFETDMAAFISDEGDLALRLSLEYELLFTQKLILSPEITLDAYGQSNQENGTGSGLASSNIGLRLRYEIEREFAPYVGWTLSKLYGNSRDYAEAAGGDANNSQWLVGIRAWF